MTIGEREIRNRFGPHPETEEVAARKKLVSEMFIAIGDFFDKYLPDGRAKSTAFTKMQEAFQWANTGIEELSRDDTLLENTSDNPTNKKG